MTTVSFSTQQEMTKVFYARLHATQDPVYGEITLARFQDKIVVTCAPTTALISPEVLFHDRTRALVSDQDRITFGGYRHRVVYRITGWDSDHRSLIVLLEEDHRND